MVAPKFASSHGNISCTKKLIPELINPTNEIAIPRIRLGNNSENSSMEESINEDLRRPNEP